MPRDETLARATAEIRAGNAEQAKRRLLGLLSTYPSDLEVRRALADAYRALGDREQSGRWRYLCSPVHPEDEIDRAAFETWAPEPWHRLNLLRWPPDAAPPDQGAELLEGLRRRAAAERRRQDIGCIITVLALPLVLLASIVLVRWAIRSLL